MKKPHYEYADRLHSLLDSCSQGAMSESLELGLQMHKDNKLIDFAVRLGQLSGRIQVNNKSVYITLGFSEIPKAKWQDILMSLSGKAKYCAKLLDGRMPHKIEDAFREAQCELIPSDKNSVTIKSECPKKQKGLLTAILYYKLCEQIEQDPFVLFSLRGMGKEEILGHLRQNRSTSNKHLFAKAFDISETKDLTCDVASFWNANSDVWSVSYSIRADELPASLFRRLDSLPLYDLEDDVEPLMDTAYVQVATRAQAFGLGLVGFK